MPLFQYTILFSENFISKVKEPSHFNMLEFKLWLSKTETKNVKDCKDGGIDPLASLILIIFSAP